jgi:hypothetical protein
VRFRNAAGQSIHLQVVGYEYPDKEPVGAYDWDANWLIVQAEMADGDRGWTFTEPCMTTKELGFLIAWLRAIAEDASVGETADFTEPLLTFRRLRREGTVTVLFVAFELEARPPWKPESSGGEWADGWAKDGLEFRLSPAQLRKAADDLTEQAKRYPERPTLSQRATSKRKNSG